MSLHPLGDARESVLDGGLGLETEGSRLRDVGLTRERSVPASSRSVFDAALPSRDPKNLEGKIADRRLPSGTEVEGFACGPGVMAEENETSNEIIDEDEITRFGAAAGDDELLARES